MSFPKDIVTIFVPRLVQQQSAQSFFLHLHLIVKLIIFNNLTIFFLEHPCLINDDKGVYTHVGFATWYYYYSYAFSLFILVFGSFQCLDFTFF
jgi:hypothetical protein